MLAKEGGYKKIAVFYKNDDWGQDMAKLVDGDLKALGIEVTASVAITDAQPSYRAEVAEALASQPEAIYLALYPKEGISVVREWISLGGTSKMIGANSLKSDEFRDTVGLRTPRQAPARSRDRSRYRVRARRRRSRATG